MNTLEQHWKGLFGKVWMSCCRGMFWGFLLALCSVFLVGISPAFAEMCVPNANHYSVTASAAAAPWNSGDPSTWTTCPPDGYQSENDWISDGNGNCCAASSVGMTQGEFVVKSFQTSALTILGITVHGFFITLNIVVRRR